MKINQLSWMVGGPQGSGVDSSARLFAIACANGGLWVFGRREYYSNIKGEHSYFQIRVDSREVRSPINDVALLASYENETVVRHVYSREVGKGSAVIYDPTLVSEKIDKIGTLDHRLKFEIGEYLQSKGRGDTVGDLLEDGKEKGLLLLPLDYKGIIEATGREIGEKEYGRLVILKNTIAVAASFGALEYDFPMLERALEDMFKGKKQQVVEMNKIAARKSYDAARAAMADQFPYQLKPLSPLPTEKRIFLQGTTAVSLGKIAAG
ncbi:MAG: 2-oxoacid:acceptor oxidoreductase family protein, partial [Methanobacteriota archaeon]